MEIIFAIHPILALIIFIIAITSIYLILKSNSPRIVKTIRLISILMCLALAMSPSLLKYDIEKKATIAIMIDCSDSMFLTRRIDEIKKHLKINHKMLSTKFNLLFFNFSDDFQETTIQRLQNIKPQGITNIAESISNLCRAYHNKLDGIILFSDGQETKANTFIDASINVPVFTWNIFENQKLKDISIIELRKPGFAFKGSDVSVIAKIQHSGIRTNLMSLTLSDDSGKIIASDSRSISSDGETEIQLSIKPTKLGKNNYTIEVSTFPGELSHINNRQHFSIDVLKDKLRILYICGQPSYEYSFLREFLKNNPTIELVTFVILRNPENISLVPDEELSLIPFPGADILMKQLNDFDLVIFENFTYQRFGIYAQHFEALKKWVENGGGFLMLGGSNSFGKGGYQYTAIREILPVVMDEPDEPFEYGPFRPQIVSYSNPIFSGENIELFKNLPPLDGAQRLKSLSQATTLIRHPWAKAENENIVVLATRAYGKGKTAALGTTSTWRWKMHSENPAVYDTFWKNLIDYLTGSLEANKTMLLGFRENVELGQTCEFAIKTQAPDISVRVEITLPNGKKTIPEIIKNGQILRLSFIPMMPGIHTIEILTYKKNRLIRTEKHKISASKTAYEEIKRLDVNTDYLKYLAQKTGGIYLNSKIAEIEKIEKKVGQRRKKEIKQEIRLNVNSTSFVILFIIIIGELILRRRKYGMW